MILMEVWAESCLVFNLEEKPPVFIQVCLLVYYSSLYQVKEFVLHSSNLLKDFTFKLMKNTGS